MSRTPIVRPISWLNAVINIGILAVFVAAGWFFAQTNGVVVAALAYIVLSQLLRRMICSHHRSAIQHCKRQEYELAIPEFQRSLKFFNENQWVDEFRAITMLSAAGMCYREMALVSLGFCFGQIGDGKNARLNYEQCIRQFPNNGMAESALRLLNAGLNSEIAT